jgi:hypothetical protein
MKTTTIPTLPVATLALILAMAVLALASGTSTSEAQGPIQMGLDMETTGNTASTLGPVDGCYELAWSGTPFDGVADWTIDVYVSGDTLSPLAYDAWVTYDNNKVHVLQGAPTDPLIKMPGAGDLSGYQVGQASFGAIYLELPYNGIPGDGTLVRIGLDIGASGVVTLGFAKGAYISTPGSLQHPVSTLGGQLAINSTCAVGGSVDISEGGADTPADAAAGSDIPGSAGAGSGTSVDSAADPGAGWSAWYYAAAIGGAAAAAAAVAVGAWYARRRWLT